MRIISKKSDISNSSIHSVYFNQLVIGSTLDALRFAYKHRIKVIYVNNGKPEDFQKAEQAEWERLTILLTLGGMVPFGEQVQHITFEEEDSTMILLTKQETRYIVNAQEIFVFDAEGLLGFFFLKKENERDIVIDHFKTKGRIPQVKLVNFTTDNNHIKEVHSYGIINAVYPYCVSYLEKDQHLLEDFSENTTRLICQRYVREHNNNQKIELTWESRKVVHKYSVTLEDAPRIFKDPTSYTGRRQHEEDFIDLLEKKGIK